MSTFAIVTKGFGPRRFHAWCEFCQDGLNYGVAKKARAWAADHNRVRHGIPDPRQHRG